MKKILATILALMMVLSLSVSAMANPVDLVSAEDPEQSVANPIEGSVTVTVNEGVDTGVIYSVTVAWDDEDIVYQKEGKGTWNPSTHQYDDVTENGWTDPTAAVTVINHSNAGVTATIKNTANPTGTNYAFSVNGDEEDSFELETAEGTDVNAELTEDNAAPNNTFTITASSDEAPTAGTDTFAITITAAAASEPENTDPVTFTIDGNEYTVDANTTWAQFAESNSETYAVVGNYIDTNNTYGNEFVLSGEQFVTADTVINAGAYTLSDAMLIDGDVYVVSDDMINSSMRLGAFIEGKSEFSVYEFTGSTVALSDPVLYTRDGVTYFITDGGYPNSTDNYVSNCTNRELGLLPVEEYYLLEINQLYLVSKEITTWRELAEVNTIFSIVDNEVVYNSSVYVSTDGTAESRVAPDDTITQDSTYKISWG